MAYSLRAGARVECRLGIGRAARLPVSFADIVAGRVEGEGDRVAHCGDDGVGGEFQTARTDGDIVHTVW